MNANVDTSRIDIDIDVLSVRTEFAKATAWRPWESRFLQRKQGRKLSVKIEMYGAGDVPSENHPKD